jgi:hypothetical protein
LGPWIDAFYAPMIWFYMKDWAIAKPLELHVRLFCPAPEWAKAEPVDASATEW